LADQALVAILASMTPDDTAGSLVAQIDAERGRIRSLVAGLDEQALSARPADGKWSVVENVRHLLFAEQHHLGRIVPGGRTWSTVGLPPKEMAHQKQLQLVGSTATTDIGDVLAAWEAIHGPAQELASQDTDVVRKALRRNLVHLRAHTKVIERLLAPIDGGPAQTPRRQTSRGVQS
jgi:hypothetical protein